MAIPFPYFMTAGANIFKVPTLRDNGAMLGQISFISGMLCSVLLYEWSRRTVVDRNFYVGLADEVPPAVCDAVPYRYVRHPFLFELYSGVCQRSSCVSRRFR
jgi:protein-S-isoprenylcysteine O-methyltransferase Ste14